jgi:hypothetical protein
MNRLLLTLAAASAIWAQDKVALIEVKYADVNRLAALMTGLGVQANPQSGFKAITVRGSAEAIAIAQETAKKLDVPEAPTPNIELTVHLLYGAAQDSAPDSVPQDLAATVKQLRSLFPYKSYRVMESFVLRGRDGQQTETSGTLPGSSTLYDFKYRPHVLPGSAPRMIRIDGLRFNLKVPEGDRLFEANINTDLDAREGQKVVVGKSNVRGTADAILLVVTPKVVE